MITAGAPQLVVLDDRLLIEEILFGLVRPRRMEMSFSTTAYWYYRACRAAASGAGGHLSNNLGRVSRAHRAAAVHSLLDLSDDIALPDPRVTVPAMARLALRHTRLNLLNLEAVAAADVTAATVWLSEESAAGILPSVLDSEHLRWAVVPLS